ncbi:MAG TPA: sulfotransferase [Stellaceae bacterium]|nr:sulfotransferase [Stellaceae bacterium]
MVGVLYLLLGKRRRWRLLEKVQPRFVSEAPIVVIGGCGSSGTTLLRRILDRHPDIECGPESTVLLDRLMPVEELAARFGFDAGELDSWQCRARSQAEFVAWFLDARLARSGKRIWADKTPENISRFDFVRRHFPNARFVHVIRDGRDVAASLRRQSWMKLRERSGAEALARCGAYWAERIIAGRRSRSDPRYIEIRYEDLISRPEATLRRLLSFLRLEWSDRLLRAEAGGEPAAGPIFPSSIGRWRHELSPPEVASLKPWGPLLSELGYEVDRSWIEPAASRRGRARFPKRWSRWERLRIEAEAFWRLAWDPRVPWRARLIGPILCGAYYLLPIDPIPDRIPVFGHFDDAIVVSLALLLFFRLAPERLLRQHRTSVAARHAQGAGIPSRGSSLTFDS